MNEYERLRTLLLNQEQEEIHLLKIALESLLKETRDPEQIIQKLVPLISQIFSLTLQNNKTDFIKVFSPIIGELLKNTIENSSAEIAVIMAPIMGKMIKEVVKNERDEIVDALYPVMGNMVGKFVAETFKNLMLEINQKVQSTFSFEMLKRKITAKIKGISETELLLQTSSRSYIIQNVFLIHKETGILISERTASGIASIEPEMVASMLTAIRSFVNDWISKNTNHFELNEIEFGDSTIRLEVAGCCYLAIVLKGTINLEGQQRIVKVLEQLVEKNSQIITNFNGDTQSLPMEEINLELDTLIQDEENQLVPTKTTSWIPLAIIALFLGAGSLFWSYQSYLANSIENDIRSTIYKNPYLNLYAIDVEVDGKIVTLKGRLPAESLHQKLLKSVSKVIPKFIIDDQVVLSNTLPIYEESFSTLKTLIDIINKEEGNRVQFHFQNGIVTLKGLIREDKIHQELLNSLSTVPGILRVVSALKTLPSGKAIELFYEIGKSSLTENNLALLDDWLEGDTVKKLLALHKDIDLIVIGYSDMRGDTFHRALIAKERARVIFKYLVKKGIPQNRITDIGVPTPPRSNRNDMSQNGRRSQIKWIKR